MSPKSGLDDTAKLIEPLLVKNIMDICMYHSKLPIDMPLNPCKFDRETRIPLVAALLRFADELDVDLYRVPEGIYKNFRLPSKNVKYWWFHERTHLYLENIKEGKVTKGKITFEVLLHPDDIKKWALRYFLWVTFGYRFSIPDTKPRNESSLRGDWY